MDFKKYLSAVFMNRKVEAYEVKNLGTLRTILGCYVIGKYCSIEFPAKIHDYMAALEIIPVMIVITLFISTPLTFTALGISQYSKKGWLRMWDCKPVWKGIAFAAIISLYISTLWTASLSSHLLYYTVRSLEEEAPWWICGKQNFDEAGCFTYNENRSIYLDCLELHTEDHCANLEWRNSAQYFKDHEVTSKYTSGIQYNTNVIPFKMVVTLMIYVGLRNSMMGIALLSPFLLYVPTILHGVLFIRSFLHPGTLRGLEVLFAFKFENVTSINFWMDFIAVSILSTGFLFGGLSNLGMKYDFRHQINMDAVFLNLACVTYAFCFSVFQCNIFGILSYELNIPVLDIVTIDSDDIFIQCALSFQHMKPAKLWTFIFYLSNFMMMVRTLIIECEMLMCNLYEWKPILKRYTIPCAISFTAIHFIIDMLMNSYWVYEFIAILDSFFIFELYPILVLYVYVAIFVFYGATNFADDMHFMLGFRPSTLFRLNWYVGTVAYFIIVILSVYSINRLGWNNYQLHYFVIALWIIQFLIPLIYFAFFVLAKRHRNVPYGEIFRSSEEWGPRDEDLRKSRDMFSAHDMTKEYLYRQKKLKSKYAEVPAVRLSADSGKTIGTLNSDD